MSTLQAVWFGLQAPGNAIASWGARAIVNAHTNPRTYATTYGLDVLRDRMQSTEGAEELTDWVDRVVTPRLRSAVKAGYWPVCNPRGEDVAGFDDGAFHFRCTPRRSYGYLYMVAWEGESDGEGFVPLP
jgi:hypothetical protein